jgi:hypothetical protein
MHEQPEVNSRHRPGSPYPTRYDEYLSGYDLSGPVSECSIRKTGGKRESPMRYPFQFLIAHSHMSDLATGPRYHRESLIEAADQVERPLP